MKGSILFQCLREILFPTVCPGCQRIMLRSGQFLCTSCRFHLPLTDHFSAEIETLPAPGIFPPQVRQAQSLLYFRKGGLTQGILHSIKYEGNQKMAFKLGQMIGLKLSLQERPLRGSLIPVPLHRRKRKIRGFNQSEVIAMGIESTTSLKVVTRLLERVRYGDSQTNKGRGARFRDLEGSFEVNKAAADHPGCIFLVDDVLTTGATASACVQVLLESFGELEIRILTLAQALN